MSDGGKGSKPRPFSVTQERFADNWDRIFKQKWDHYSDLPSTESYSDVSSPSDSLDTDDKKN